MRITVFKTAQTHAREPMTGLFMAFFLKNALKLQTCRNVINSRSPGHQCLGLEHVDGSLI